MNIDQINQRLRYIENTLPSEALPIDPYLLLLAITHETGEKYLPHILRENMQRKWSLSNYEELEFLGDAILDFAVVRLIFNQRHAIKFTSMSRIKDGLIKNLNLYCQMLGKNLCEIIIGDPNIIYKKKVCADVFESILAAVYLSLENKRNRNIIDTIIEWLINTFNLNIVLRELIEKGEYICPALGKTITNFNEQK